MEGLLIVGGIAVGIVLVVLIWFIGAYNSLVRMRNSVDNAWAQIDVQLKRRHDLIPNLVETVRGYAKHEQSTLESVMQARYAAMNARGVPEISRAEGMLTAALGRLFAVVENYPDLKANQNFLALQEELTSTENKIGFARQYYNDEVMRYNTATQSIPTNFVAAMANFRPRDFFKVESEAERQAPQVKF